MCKRFYILFDPFYKILHLIPLAAVSADDLHKRNTTPNTEHMQLSTGTSDSPADAYFVLLSIDVCLYEHCTNIVPFQLVCISSFLLQPSIP